MNDRSPLQLPYRDRILDNGLRVIVHEDRSDPVVAVQVSYHVGSAREEAGRSGLAHLFEHLMFEGSQSVAAGEHFRLIQASGGNLNGTTSFDRTWYYETMPVQHVETALWLEADRMGGLLAALSQHKLDNQRDVVKNERRQSYDNRPYGRIGETLHAALFPEGHPYSWVPIGSMADLDAATLDDVRGFFARWYGPNNAVLVIAGDIGAERALELAEKHFGAIPRGPEVGSPAKQPVRLAADVAVTLEDRVQLAQLTLAWPTVHAGSRDQAPLRLAMMILSQNKSAVLDRALTVERRLAQHVTAYSECLEIAGDFTVQALATPGTPLGRLEDEIRTRIDRVGREGVERAHLERMQSRIEADHVHALETVQGKAQWLAAHAVLHGDPKRGESDLAQLLATTPDQVADVIARYLGGRPAVVLSTVPQGRRELAVAGRAPAVARAAAWTPKPRPESDPRPRLRLPPIWRETLEGLDAAGTPYAELPMSTFGLALPAGRLHETPETAGIASLTAALVLEGTRKLSTTELTDEIDRMGAQLHAWSHDEELAVRASVLDKHLPEAAALFAEVALAPRFAHDDFERLREQQLVAIDTRGDQIGTIAANAWSRIVYGEQCPLGWPEIGTRESLERLELADVREFHARALARSGARFIFAGAMPARSVASLFAPLAGELARRRDHGAGATPPPRMAPARRREIFLIDKPGAAQSELRVGHLAVSAVDPDFFPLIVLNYVLGGAFTSRLNQNLREKHGFTYGASSIFEGDHWPGPFTAYSAVHTEATAAALTEMLREIEGVRESIGASELQLARDALSQSLLRQYEMLNARLGLVDNVSRFGWPEDYPVRRLEWLERATTDELAALARRHIRPAELSILVVGDRAAIHEQLSALGPIRELDLDGRPLVGARA